MRLGINLLWVRPGKNGGTESYIRNLLDGFMQDKSDNEYVLYVSKTNRDSFNKYFEDKRFICRLCQMDSRSQVKRVLWENLCINKVGKKDNLDVWFIPVYCKPFLTSKKIPYVTVIHDIQAKHYPEYFSKVRNKFFDLSWKSAVKSSEKIITISNFCKEDIEKYYPNAKGKTEVIYNPIIMQESKLDFSEVALKFGIKEKEYFYTVSALAKHKNLITLLKAMKMMKLDGKTEKLIITGVKVNAQNEIAEYIKENDLTDCVILTGYISNEERDCLYDNCKAFLFPSVFEGFGMPPIEALMRGVPTITTKKTSIYEVTQGKADYVDSPFDEKEWFQVMNQVRNERKKYEFNEYSLERVTKAYLNVLESVRISSKEREEK